MTKRQRREVRHAMRQRQERELLADDHAWGAYSADLDRRFAAVRADLARPAPVSTPEGLVWMEGTSL